MSKDPSRLLQNEEESCETVSAVEYLAKEKELEKQARELMPFSPDTCTYSMGALRQEVYACLDCQSIGVCYSCSIQCHAEHRLVELFTKREFTCDCGTEKSCRGQFCQIRKNTDLDIPSYTNRYCHNFQNLFCACNKEYDSESETGEMIQCCFGLECNEDWYHDYCIQRERKRETTNDDDDNGKLPLTDLTSFDSFVCWKCVGKYMKFFDEFSNFLQGEVVLLKVIHEYQTGDKRLHIQDDEKDRSPLPYSIFFNQDCIDFLKLNLKNDGDAGFAKKHSYLYKFLTTIGSVLINPEPLYQPPKDNEDDESYTLASQAVTTHVQRDVAIKSLQKIDELKENLKKFLQPFADSNKVVSKEDIQKFFSSK